MPDALHSTDARDESARAAIAEAIAGFEGSAAMLARNLDTGAELAYAPDAVLPTASTIKILVLAELLRQVADGRFDLDAPVALLPEDRRGGSGILKDLSPGALLTLRDHAVLMIALSDNTSTALCVRLVGLEQIMASAREWGLTSTSGLISTRTGNGPAREYAASSPRDLVLLLQLIAEDRLVSPEMSAIARDILLTQQYHEQLARYLPYQPYNRDGAAHPGPLIVRSKSGFTRDNAGSVRVDAGIIELLGVAPARWVICCMTEGSPDTGWTADHPGTLLNARISRLVYDAWSPVLEVAPAHD